MKIRRRSLRLADPAAAAPGTHSCYIQDYPIPESPVVPARIELWASVRPFQDLSFDVEATDIARESGSRDTVKGRAAL
jgi:hypothetical protein